MSDAHSPNTPQDPHPPWLVVTGISGSGRTTCLRALEDVGWFCVDNLPARMLPALHDCMRERAEQQPVAVGIDVRAGGLIDDIDAGLTRLGARGVDVQLLFVDCADDVLVRRFAETRRKHPVWTGRTILDAIHRERELMLALRERTALVIDTTTMNVHQLKARVQQLFGGVSDTPRMTVAVRSFGFKHGLVRDADYVFDARCLDNPHFVPELRPRTGLDPEVRDYVLGPAGGQAWLDHVLGLLDHALPRHEAEGRALVTVAVGCTGGQHRSVALSEAVAAHLGERDTWAVQVSHRDRPTDAPDRVRDKPTTAEEPDDAQGEASEAGSP